MKERPYPTTTQQSGGADAEVLGAELVAGEYCKGGIRQERADSHGPHDPGHVPGSCTVLETVFYKLHWVISKV